MRIEHTQDTSVVRTLGRQWVDSCHAQDFGFEIDIDVIIEDVEAWLTAMPGVILVAFDPLPVGFFIAYKIKSFMGMQHVCLERYWYSPKSKAGIALFKEAKLWGQMQGCSHLLVSASNLASDVHDKVKRFCEHQGMKLFETAYITEL